MFTRRVRSSTDRGWGPFSGGQLTIIIVTLAALVMVPGAAYAVTAFTNVAIQDPTTGARASVDATHHLVVGDGSGPLSVDGNVAAHPLAPALPFHFSQDVGTAEWPLVGPSSVPIDLTNLTLALHLSNGTGSTADVIITQYAATANGTACDVSNNAALQQVVYRIPNVQPTAPVVITFPTPLVLKPAAGHKICLVGTAQGSSLIVASGSGFYG
jgi:hypothetical protein